MPTTNATKKPLTYLAAFVLLAGPVAAKERVVESTKDDQVSKGSEADARIHVPNRPSTSLFKGKQGEQKAEIYLDPDTHTHRDCQVARTRPARLLHSEYPPRKFRSLRERRPPEECKR